MMRMAHHRIWQLSVVCTLSIGALSPVWGQRAEPADCGAARERARSGALTERTIERLSVCPQSGGATLAVLWMRNDLSDVERAALRVTSLSVRDSRVL